MSSAEEIREARAVAGWIQQWDGDGDADGLIPNVVAAGAFARAYANLLENGQEVEFRLDSDQHWSNTLLPAFNGEGRYLVVRLEEE